MFIERELFEKKLGYIIKRLDKIDKTLANMAKQRCYLDGELLYDNYDLCKLLNISKRTLQYRNIILICNKLSRYIDITGNDIETTKPHYPALIFIDSNNSVGQQHCFRFPLQELYMRLSPHTAQAIQSSNLLNLS